MFRRERWFWAKGLHRYILWCCICIIETCLSRLKMQSSAFIFIYINGHYISIVRKSFVLQFVLHHQFKLWEFFSLFLYNQRSFLFISNGLWLSLASCRRHGSKLNRLNRRFDLIQSINIITFLNSLRGKLLVPHPVLRLSESRRRWSYA